ncbi:MAG: uroporphyrinogen-III C-methyltransferase [Candidatus Omnitrophica bacterium]|nr:uroporphyrinogen-III C-methyltransferase [Candidatus Omnitrophota bacterium]
MSNKNKFGKVFLVGAGPGDIGLITAKAIACVQAADIILYDKLIDKDILKYRKSGSIIEYVGKEKGKMFQQEGINDLLLEYARTGKTVARLKGGDPFIFGRGQEEMLFLKEHGIDCEVIPGVSSFYAVPELCGIPLTHRDISSGFMVLTGHENPNKIVENVEWKHAAKFNGTIVIMMGLSNLAELTGKLIKYGKSAKTLAAVIAHGVTPKQKIVIGTMGDIAKKSCELTSPAICVIGDVVKVGFSLNPDLKPLLNKHYLSTASEDLNRDMNAILKQWGATLDCLPMIRIEENKDTVLLDQIISDVKKFDWLVFTSRHGVQYFLKRFAALKGKMNALNGRLACVGTGTAREFTKCGIQPDLMPAIFTTKDLGLALLKQGISGKKLALIRTKMDTDPLKKMLKKSGADITDCFAYNVADTNDTVALKKAVTRKLDGIFFLSPRSVRVFFELMPEKDLKRVKKEISFFSIGTVTTQALKKQGVKIVKAPKEHTVQGLVNLCLGE